MALKGLPQLIEITKKCESVMAKLEKGEVGDKETIEYLTKMMVNFQKISEQAGLVALKRLGRELEKYLRKPSLNPEELTALAFVFPTLKSGLETESIEDIRAAVLETFELLNIPIPTDWQTSKFVIVKEKEEPEVDLEELKAKAKPEPKEKKAVEVSEERVESVNRAVKALGGDVKVGKDGSVTIVVPPENVEKVQRLVAPVDPEADFAKDIKAETDTEKEILVKIKEFMAAFSSGDLEKAQEILDDLSKIKEGSGVYQEIGQLARHLHSTLKELMSALDPALKELALDYLPDSESRLQHLIKLTEEATHTTLDCAERMNERDRKDLELIETLRRHLNRLKPIGRGAEARLDEMEAILKSLEESRKLDKEDISAILSAQNFQDLSGQTAIKVMDIIKELQDRLIGIIRTFGMKIDKKAKDKDKDLLKGPAHEKMEGVLRSQDEVDALLAELGF